MEDHRNKAGEAFEEAVEAWIYRRRPVIVWPWEKIVLLMAAAYLLGHFARWAHLGFRVVGH